VHLKGLTNLQKLNLYRNQITDAGLVHLTGLTGLQLLTLGGTKVTDAGVAELQDPQQVAVISSSSSSDAVDQGSDLAVTAPERPRRWRRSPCGYRAVACARRRSGLPGRGRLDDESPW
jgi:hypothetical protein